MVIIIRFRNKETARYEIEDDSFAMPSGSGFQQIGKSKETGTPLVVNVDDVLSIGPDEDYPAPFIA